MGADLSQETDEQLITACQTATPERKRELVGELASRHYQGLLNFVTSIVRDRVAAEDLVQETFIRVYRRAESYQTVARFSTWLYTIARNLSLNEIRNRKRRPALALNSQVGGADDRGGELSSLLPGTDLEPGEILEKQDLAMWVRRTISELPEAFREVLILCDLQKMSYQECADILQIKIGTVRSRLSRARAQFAEKMKRSSEKMGVSLSDFGAVHSQTSSSDTDRSSP